GGGGLVWGGGALGGGGGGGGGTTRSGGHAAVDGQHRSGHVRGGVGGEEAHARRHLLGRPGASGGDRREQVAVQIGGHVGLDQARRDRVDGHAAARDLGRDRLRHRDQA